jgi:hypothetical protein
LLARGLTQAEISIERSLGAFRQPRDETPNAL